MLRAGSRKGRKSVVASRSKSPSARRRLGAKRAAWRRSEVRTGSAAKKSSRSKVASRSGRIDEKVSKARPLDGQDYKVALTNFETAAKYFSKRNYEKAAVYFQKVLGSSARELRDRARVRLRLCEQKARQEPAPKTAEDYYLRGIGALNSRDIEQAIQYLKKSDKIGPRQDHVHYALAAAHALQCNVDEALVHLQAAIELRPASRVQARLDEDFQLLAGDPRFERLLGVHAH